MNQTARHIGQSVLICLASLYLTSIINAYTLKSTPQYLFIYLYFIVIALVFTYLKNKYLGKNDNVTTLGATIVAIIILCLFQNAFLPLTQETTVVLSGVGQSAESTGSEVWLADVKIDDKSVLLHELEASKCVGWTYAAEYDDYVYYPNCENGDNSLSFQISSQRMVLRFATGPWCGIVKIVTPYGTETLDLYSASSGDGVDYTISTAKQYLILERFFYNLGAVTVLTFLISTFLNVLKKRLAKRLYSAAPSAVSGRNSAADVLRITAAFLVVSVHFFLNSGFYAYPISGKNLYIMTAFRSLCMSCVPLFIMLTGYLNSNKTLSKRYYKGLIKTVSVYVLASLACAIYKILFLDEEYTLLQIITGITGFTLDNYAWYIEMYLGLFLMTPFINLLYNAITAKEQKQVLLGTMVFLTAVPGVLNAIEHKLLIAWWMTLYPFTYYFIGAYIREFGFRFKKTFSIFVLFVTTVVLATVSFADSYGENFVWGTYSEYGALPVLINTTMIFGMIINLKTGNWTKTTKVILQKISGLCLGIYLTSFIFDSAFYQILNTRIVDVPRRMYYMPIIVPCVFVCSLALSWVLDKIYAIIYTALSKKGTISNPDSK